MASGARKKGKVEEEEEIKKSMMDVERAMNDMIVNFGENVRGQETHAESTQVHFNTLAKMVDSLPEGEQKTKVQKQLEEEQSAAADAKVDRKKQLMRTMDDIKRKRFDEGDQSPLTGREALNLQNQWQMGMDYTPVNPFSQWMKVIFTGNYEGMMNILEGMSDMEVVLHLNMRESLMNVPAVLHVVYGAKVVHSSMPSMLAEKRRIQGVLEVKHDHMKILEKLIELGADLTVKDVAGCTFLHHCFSGCGNPTTTAMAGVVLKAGLDPNIQDRFGFTPLFRCMQTGVLNDVELLLKYGADPSIKDFDHGFSCLKLAQAFPAANRLFGKYRRKDAVKEREKVKEEMGGSLKRCVECGKDNSARCSGCFIAHYCSAACQKDGWRKHKDECKETRARYKRARLVQGYNLLWNNQSNKHRVTVGANEPSEVPTGQFVVKVQVPLSKEKGSLLVYNKDRTLKGGLAREDSQEELYDKLAKEVRKNGFRGEKGFFPAICKRDSAESEGYKLEINPDQMLPVETW